MKSHRFVRLCGAVLAVASLTLLRPAGRVDAAGQYVRPSEARLRADVSFLADDLREGRGVGTEGIDAAADYIATVFRELGLKPAPGADGYFQPFTIRGRPRLGEPVTLAVSLPEEKTLKGELKKDFSPLAVGGAGKVEGAGLVFAGYGITAKDERLNLDYDDYAGIDVKGKVVLILRREPQQDNAESPFAGKETTSYATFTSKAVNAAKHDAAAVLLVNDAAGSKGRDELLDFGATPGGATIPFVMVTRAFADKILAAAGQPSLEEFEAQIDSDLTPRSRALEGVKVDAEVTIGRESIEAKNVIAVLEGEGPLADETIVIGAHYDHLGKGGPGSLAFGSQQIHNGADDNASGSAMVLEMARRLARRPEPLPRRIVFMTFSGEERGLLGSAHYVEHPLYPLDKTVAMINFDMVGRLNDDRELTVFGAGTSNGLEQLIESLATSQGLKPKMIVGTRGEFNQSDHASFYRKDIPVVFFFTGTHADYHRPSDDTDKINFDGMLRVADLAELLLLDLARRPERPNFNRLGGGAPTVAGALRGGSGVYFGSRPSYGFNGEGVKLEGVSEGSPAEKAGLKGGDIIVKFGDLKVVDVESFMAALGSRKPGDEVEVVVLRDGKETTLKAKLGSRPARGAQD